MKARKAQRRLNARIKHFDNMSGSAVVKGSNYKKPGSLKK